MRATRRHLLQGFFAALAFVPGGPGTRAAGAAPEPAVARLTELCATVSPLPLGTMRTIGRELAETGQALPALDFRTLDTPGGRDALTARIRADYAEGDCLTVKGWYVSSTEAALYRALVA